MGRRVSMLCGFLVGGMVGWVAGILSAPQPGEATRQVIGEKAIELQHMAGEAVELVKEEVLTSLERSAEIDA